MFFRSTITVSAMPAPIQSSAASPVILEKGITTTVLVAPAGTACAWGAVMFRPGTTLRSSLEGAAAAAVTRKTAAKKARRQRFML